MVVLCIRAILKESLRLRKSFHMIVEVSASQVSLGKPFIKNMIKRKMTVSYKKYVWSFEIKQL